MAGVGNALLGGITDVVFIREGLVDANVNVFVDSSRNKKAAELFVLRRQIGSSAANRNTKRSSHDNHKVILVEYSNKVSRDIAPILQRFCRFKSTGEREPNAASTFRLYYARIPQSAMVGLG